KALTDCSQRDNADLSIQGCTTLIEQHPRYSIPYRNRADAYLIKGDYDRALADYTKSIEIDPRNPLTFNNRGYVYSSKGESRGPLHGLQAHRPAERQAQVMAQAMAQVMALPDPDRPRLRRLDDPAAS